MTPLKAFRIIKALTLHFKSDFSISKYGMNSSKFISAFSSLSEEQKRIYVWASNKFSSDQDLIYATISNLLSSEDIRFSNKETVMENFFKLKARREALTYYLSSEYKKWYEKKEPLKSYIFKYLVKEVSPEFIILLSEYEGSSLESLYEDQNYTFISQEVFKLIKYKELFSYKKYASLFTQEEELVS